MQLKIISRSNSFSSVCIDDNMFIVINETVNLHEKVWIFLDSFQML